MPCPDKDNGGDNGGSSISEMLCKMFDPTSDYEVDVFAGPRKDGPEKNMAVDYVAGVGTQVGVAANGRSGELSLTWTGSIDWGVVTPDVYVYSGFIKNAATNDDLNTPARMPSTSLNVGIWRTGVSVDMDTHDVQGTFGPSAWYVSLFGQKSATSALFTIPYLGYVFYPEGVICRAVIGG